MEEGPVTARATSGESLMPLLKNIDRQSSIGELSFNVYKLAVLSVCQYGGAGRVSDRVRLL